MTVNTLGTARSVNVQSPSGDLALLRRHEVRDIAAKAGLSIERAETAVAMLDGKNLQEAAQQARQVQDNLAGGANTNVISTTTVIIVLLIIILIVVIAK